MTNKELEKELRYKYSQNKGNLSDPIELLDMVIDTRNLKDEEKQKAYALADEVYFQIGRERE